MSTNPLRSIALITVPASLLFGSATALAAKVTTPFGPVDDHCVTKVPTGGHIDVQSKIVSLNGKAVGSAVRCDEPIVAPSCTAAGGWYAYSEANATTIDGLAQYNYFQEYWTIPEHPNPPSGDSPLEYFFPSLQAGIGTSNESAILQPVLSWGYDAQEWEISSWGLFGCNTSCECSYTFVNITPGPQAGDTVNGTISQYESNPDAWEVYTVTSSGWYANTYVDNIPSSWPKFNLASSAVNENYSLNSCQDLSPQNSIKFNNEGLYQAGPAWDTYNDVTNSASWHYYNNPNNLFPSCSWGAGGNASSGTLSWKE